MLELESRIARLEMRIEQFVIHLRQLDRTTSAAERARCELLSMLHNLRYCKARRQKLEDDIVSTGETMSLVIRGAHQIAR